MNFDNPDHPDHGRYKTIVNRVLWIPALIVFHCVIGELISEFFLKSFQFYIASPFLFYWWVFVCDMLFILILKWKVHEAWFDCLIGMLKFWHDGIVSILRGR